MAVSPTKTNVGLGPRDTEIERSMEVIQTKTDGLKREFKVIVDAKDIESRIQDRLEDLRKTARIPGFRPGKAPAELLRKRYGESLRNEIVEQALNQTSSQALAEQAVRPAMQPRIEVTKSAEGDDLEYTMAVEMMPEISPGNFEDLKLTRYTAEASDSDIDRALEGMAANAKSYAPVAKPRKAKKGDALVIDFVGKVDGVEIEGGSGKDHRLELGSSAFVEGFEDQLIGVKPGDHVEVNLTFPDKYVNDALAGKDAVFAVDVKEIQEVRSVPVDDAFAKGHGFDDLAAMRAALKQQMDQEFAGVSRARLKRALLDDLAERYDFPVPGGLVEVEFEAIWQRIEEDRANDRIDPDDAGRSDEELRAEYRGIAERRVRLGLLLAEIGQRNNVVIDQDELNRAVIERARSFPGQEDKVRAHYRDNPEALTELRAPLLEEKVVDLIVSKANVTEKKVSAEKLMSDTDADAPVAKPKAPTRKKAAPKKKAAAKPDPK